MSVNLLYSCQSHPNIEISIPSSGVANIKPLLQQHPPLGAHQADTQYSLWNNTAKRWPPYHSRARENIPLNKINTRKHTSFKLFSQCFFPQEVLIPILNGPSVQCSRGCFKNSFITEWSLKSCAFSKILEMLPHLKD